MKIKKHKIISPFLILSWIAVLYFGFIAMPILFPNSDSEATRKSMHHITTNSNFYTSLIVSIALNYLYLRLKKSNRTTTKTNIIKTILPIIMIIVGGVIGYHDALTCRLKTNYIYDIAFVLLLVVFVTIIIKTFIKKEFVYGSVLILCMCITIYMKNSVGRGVGSRIIEGDGINEYLVDID